MNQAVTDLTDEQSKTIFWITKIGGGGASILCSLYLITKILRDHTRRKKIYHRIMVALNVNSVLLVEQFSVIHDQLQNRIQFMVHSEHKKLATLKELCFCSLPLPYLFIIYFYPYLHSILFETISTKRGSSNLS